MNVPSLPSTGEPVLLHVADKTKVRAVLREALAAWSGLPQEELPLRETGRGPGWIGLLAGHSLDISLSYCGQAGWIGLLRGGWIGIDAMRVEPMAEASEVALHYFDPEVRAAIQQSPDPVRAFALAWTELEARLKCVKHELIEWSPGHEELTARCLTYNCDFPGDTVVTVANCLENGAVEHGAHGKRESTSMAFILG